MTYRLTKALSAKKDFEQILKNPQQHFLIHYSCESFLDHPQRSHRVTSIAIRNLASGQTDSYSIFQYAEKLGLKNEDIKSNYDEIEKVMLNDYFDKIERLALYKFVHWNMRDVNFGFRAIEHRGEILGCRIFKITEENKIDLARLLELRFSENYANKPKMLSIATINDAKHKQMLTGAEEAKAFEDGEYVKLHQSTLRKVHLFEHLISDYADGRLKTLSKFYEVYGLTPTSILKYLVEHWIYSLASIIALIITFYQFYKWCTDSGS